VFSKSIVAKRDRQAGCASPLVFPGKLSETENQNVVRGSRKNERHIPATEGAAEAIESPDPVKFLLVTFPDPALLLHGTLEAFPYPTARGAP
jgi:hypothetical protein